MSASESPLSEQARDLFEGMTWELEYLIRQFDPSGKDSDWNDARRLVEKARREAVVQESQTTDHSGDANKMVEDHFPDATKMTELEAQNRELTERIKRLEDAGNDLVWWFCQIEPSQLSPVQTSALKQWRDLRVGRNP